MGQDQTKLLQNQLFDIKFTAKQLRKEAEKGAKKEAQQTAKVKAALLKGDKDLAQLCAENALREKQTRISLLRLSAQMDSVAQRLEQAIIMGRVSKLMSKSTTGLETALKSMDPAQISKVMDRFSVALGDIEVTTDITTKELDRTFATSSNQDDVQTLMQQVADENNLTLASELRAAPTTKLPTRALDETDSLEARFRALN